ncbi:MAG: FMN-binding protein [Christensenella sp.]|nr:FMN-binding protein [Christensenella sp.]
MKKKLFKKITALTLTRRIIQIAALILFPGLFISTFSAIKAIYVSIINGTFSTASLAGQIILAVSMLLITAIMGRFFCGFLCAFGSMGDFFWYLGSKLKIQRPKIGSRADRILKKIKYVLLVGIVLLIWTLGVSILNGTGNPWTVFGMLTKLSGWTDMTVLVSVGMLLLLLTVVGSLYIERFFCRYLCPLGAVFAIVSRFRLFKIRKPRGKCGPCRACTKRCSMGISLYRTNVVTSAECIDCMNCVEICPRENVSANPKPAFAAAIAVASLAGMYYAGNIAGSMVTNQQVAALSESVSTTQSANAGPFIDGTYQGSASGFHGETSVSVAVENGYINKISVLSTGDDPEFFNQAKASIIPAIVRAQSVGVDTVSGATFSSNGLIGAVKTALSGALNGSSDVSIIETDPSSQTPTPVLTPSPSPVPTPTSNPTATPGNAGPIALADGVYTGTGDGFRGKTKVAVTVAGGYMTEIKILSYQDDEKYFSHAKKTLIPAVISAQSVEVDTVSGATYSSMGILEAILNALGENYLSASAAGAYADTMSSATNGGSLAGGSGSGGAVDTVSSATTGSNSNPPAGSGGAVDTVSSATTGSISNPPAGGGSNPSSQYEEEHEDDDD